MNNVTATGWGVEPSFVTRPAFTLPPDGCVQPFYEHPVDDTTPEGFDRMCLLRRNSVKRVLGLRDLSRKNLDEAIMGLMEDGLFYYVIPHHEVPL